ncbi:hypothetical protein CO174_02955 [Candidatus Uhrbacteria bacterium CG_4_9_14_3_um_filter_50_9]|uniref:Uncharacterized protein n=1 Tax=Candidatus Uhrbacteria bacterium CG_4_9_14_3_um_filter_50_9 TaxID=1975035 RepID=A0A2M7XC98_9BACT|nr:MAG: hypothetical protein CO174_02955 [Candidatus Uhrbacteria bacterium CG_4_9_14_3_um_filter_50_9]
MARIEKQTDVKEELTKMKGEMVREVRRSGKKARPVLVASLVVLAVLVLIGLFVCWSLAATGLVRVPVFTALAYDVPQPERVVEPGVPLETVAEEQFRSELAKRLQAGGGELKDDVLVFSASESSLTASFRTALEESQVGMIDAGSSQILVQEEVGFSLFLPFEESELESALLVEVNPAVVDEVVVLTLTSVQIGSLNLPLFVVTRLFQPMLQTYVNDLNEAMAGFATITDISTQEGWIEITSRFSVEIN